MPVAGWLRNNGQNYTEGMVIPFVADWNYDFSKLILSEGKCQAMSFNSQLKLFYESATYGSSGSITIFDSLKNASSQMFVDS